MSLASLLDRLRGRPIEHDLSTYREVLARVCALEPTVAALDDAGLTARARALRARVADGAEVEPQLPEAFALAREAARRALGQRPFDEQVLAGVALARGKIAEMATGEGKTLAAVAPVFLHALAGRGAHVLTFNDYLARRDAAWMGPVYERLGLSVGFVQERMSVGDRQHAYAADVTYLTAKEAGFDHLRDALALEPGERSQRAYHFALVDEADSILIDEARIPLVIAGETGEAETGPERLAALVRDLVPGRDFDTDEHAHNIALTEAGTARVEAALGGRSLHALENVSLHAQLRHALHAEHLLKRDVDYIVRGEKVELVDESTGRVADRRHWPDGLHAAVEAKEGLRLSSEGRILGQVTLQHFLGLYPRLAGMTATAHTAAEELDEFYGLRTVVVPTHRPMVRTDLPDVVFTHPEAKRAALVDRDRAGPRGGPAGARRHRERRGVGGAGGGARRGGGSRRGAERAERREGGRDRRPGGRARGGHDFDEHGRPWDGHPPRRHGRGAPGRGGGRGRPLRDRHEPPRQPPHRPAAARARRPAGRPRVFPLLREPRGSAHPTLRRRAARVRPSPPSAAGDARRLAPAASRDRPGPADRRGRGL